MPVETDNKSAFGDKKINKIEKRLILSDLSEVLIILAKKINKKNSLSISRIEHFFGEEHVFNSSKVSES